MDAATALVADRFGAALEELLPARSAICWRGRRRGEAVVLRRHLDHWRLGRDAAGRSLAWQSRAVRLAAEGGWPVPVGLGDPIEHDGSWWTLERFLPGVPRRVDAAERARIIADWHATCPPLDQLGRRPGWPERLDILTDPDAAGLLERCTDAEDRSWLLRRWDDVAAAAVGVDWSASRLVLVHGDLTPWNLLWDGSRLSGLLDLELCRVDRRVSELTLSWRCRHDDLVLALDRIDPLCDDEWRMLLADWWSQLLTQAAAQLRRGQQPDRWTLDALRRESPLSLALQRGERPPPSAATA